jgi:hypothetical protein
VVAIGEVVDMSCELHGDGDETLLVDYALEFVQAGGKTGRKVFKWRRCEIRNGEPLALRKSHSFRPVTTRRHFPGAHAFVLLVNGQELGRVEFELRE